MDCWGKVATRRPGRRWERASARKSAAVALLAILGVATSALADSTSIGAHMPGPTTRWALGVEGQRLIGDGSQPGRASASSAVVLHLDDAMRARGFALTWGLSLGAMQASEMPDPSASMGALFRLRLGGAIDLTGWNMFWPGELLLTSQAEVFVDGRDVLYDGTRAAAFFGLRLLTGYGDALRLAANLEVAPFVFGSGPGGASVRSSMARARLSFGLKRVQLCADIGLTDAESLQQGAWRSVRAVRAGLSVVIGLGGA